MVEETLDDPSLRKQRHVARDQPETLEERFGRLPAADRNFLHGGSFVLALNSSLCGLTANNLLRNTLNIVEGRFASALPMAFMPFISTLVVYEGFVSQPLMEGDLNCATCALVRGGLIGAVVGCLYPALIAVPLNAGLATRYSTAPMPSKENAFRYWMTVCKPVYKKLRFAAILQVVLGAFLSSKHHDLYIKMLQLPEPGRDPEELSDRY